MRVLAESHRLGGAANVINNVLSLGAQVTACGSSDGIWRETAECMTCVERELLRLVLLVTSRFKRLKKVGLSPARGINRSCVWTGRIKTDFRRNLKTTPRVRARQG